MIGVSPEEAGSGEQKQQQENIMHEPECDLQAALFHRLTINLGLTFFLFLTRNLFKCKSVCDVFSGIIARISYSRFPPLHSCLLKTITSHHPHDYHDESIACILSVRLVSLCFQTMQHSARHDCRSSWDWSCG